jgi:DNA repair exonuclease SbcCD ATPase subunit
MNKLSAVGIFLSLVACTLGAFAMVEMRKLNDSVAALQERLGKVDGQPAAGTPDSTDTAARPAGPASFQEVAAELAKIKQDLGQVRSAQDEQATSLATLEKRPVAPAGGDTVKPTDEAVKVAVEAVLAERDKARAEADAKRRDQMMAGAQTAMLDNLAKELGLTEQQRTQVGEILKVQMDAFRGVWTNREEGSDPRAKMEELKKDTDTKIKAVLTPEQGIKYDEIAKEPMRMFGGGFGGGFGGRGGGNGGGGR